MWYCYEPEIALKNETHKILWDFEIHISLYVKTFSDLK